MGFETRGEAVIAACSLEDLKLVYRVLHQNLRECPELMESDFLGDLQEFLHRTATLDGVDATDHGAWDAWLGKTGSLGCRPSRRQ